MMVMTVIGLPGTVLNLDSGLWTGPWTRLWIFRPEFQSRGVKGHMHIYQQQSLSIL